MNRYLSLALRLEEKAAKLTRQHPRRAGLLALATAARLLGIELLADWKTPQSSGLYAKRAQAARQTAQSLPDGPQKHALLQKAEQSRLQCALAKLSRLPSTDSKAA